MQHKRRNKKLLRKRSRHLEIVYLRRDHLDIAADCGITLSLAQKNHRRL